MRNKNGEIQKEDIEWLYSAIDSYDEQIIYIFDDSAMAADGYRLHVINPDKLPEDIESMNTHDFLKKTINLEPCLATFCVNPELLAKALSTFEGEIKIELLGAIDSFHGIKISSQYNNNVAFVACMEEKDGIK